MQFEPFAQVMLQLLSFVHVSEQLPVHVKLQFCLSLQVHAKPQSPLVPVLAGVPVSAVPFASVVCPPSPGDPDEDEEEDDEEDDVLAGLPPPIVQSYEQPTRMATNVSARTTALARFSCLRGRAQPLEEGATISS